MTRTFIALCFLLVGVYCAPMFGEQPNDHWSLFKRVYRKEYRSANEEKAR